MSEPRPSCARCLRPIALCWCAHITPIETRTRVVLLQHPREADVAIGTARMAHLCLPRSELFVGVHWEGTRALERIGADPERPPALLYPGEGAIDVLTSPPASPITLVVIDGTWAQARKIANENAVLRALPRYAFRPPRPSQYRIRREPDEHYVSTIEALSYVLGALEGAPERFEAMLRPFEAMVGAQLAYAEAVRAPRRLARPRRGARGASVPLLLRDRREDLVCVVAEANAWPHGHPLRDQAARGELVHLVAVRLATGERFDALARPRMPLAPSTARHLALDEASLLAAPSVGELTASWRAFLRERDVIVTWGALTGELLALAGAETAHARVDLRTTCRVLTSRSVGALESIGGHVEPPRGLRGRAGARLGRLAALTPRVVVEGARLFAASPVDTNDGAGAHTVFGQGGRGRA